MQTVQMLKESYDAFPDCVVVLDAAENVLYCNQIFLTLIQADASTVTGKPFLSLPELAIPITLPASKP